MEFHLCQLTIHWAIACSILPQELQQMKMPISGQKIELPINYWKEITQEVKPTSPMAFLATINCFFKDRKKEDKMIKMQKESLEHIYFLHHTLLMLVLDTIQKFSDQAIQSTSPEAWINKKLKASNQFYKYNNSNSSCNSHYSMYPILGAKSNFRSLNGLKQTLSTVSSFQNNIR